MLLLAVGGVSWVLWDQATRRTELSERMAETERTVNAALVTMQKLGEQAGKMPRRTSEEAAAILVVWQQAEAALAPALAALNTGTADDRLRQQVLDMQHEGEQQRAQAQRKAKLLRDLDEARQSRSTVMEDHLDYAGAAAQYASTFAAYGLEVKAELTEELARRIRAEEPGIRDALIVALDDWRDIATWAKTVELANLVWALAAAADDDPWRRQYRKAATARGSTALVALSGEARQLSLPPSSLHLVAMSLNSQGAGDEALDLLRSAHGRHLTDFWIHFELGFLLLKGGDESPVILEEAIGCFRTALALRPAASAAHTNLGTALYNKKQMDQAMAEFRKVIDLEPKCALAHHNLGNALSAKNEWDEAITEYRMAIELQPKYAPAHYGFGNTLMAKNQLDEAIAEYRQAIDLRPDHAEAHCNLANTFRLQGQLATSLDFYKRGHALGSKRKDWHYPSAQWVADAERLVRLEAKLADVLAGKATATDNNERLGLLEVCGLTRRHVAAARLYADAFTADPKLADDLKAGHRYNAACYAALAAAGQGTDADKLDDQEHRRLRHQALAWLRADLEAVEQTTGGRQARGSPSRAGHARALAGRQRPGRCA